MLGGWGNTKSLVDDPAAKGFDVVLIVAILTSVLVVMLESVASIQSQYARELLAAEWFFTVLFTAEYLLRLWVLQTPLRYARSFFGVVDLLSMRQSGVWDILMTHFAYDAEHLRPRISELNTRLRPWGLSLATPSEKRHLRAV